MLRIGLTGNLSPLVEIYFDNLNFWLRDGDIFDSFFDNISEMFCNF